MKSIVCFYRLGKSIKQDENMPRLECGIQRYLANYTSTKDARGIQKTAICLKECACADNLAIFVKKEEELKKNLNA